MYQMEFLWLSQGECRKGLYLSWNGTVDNYRCALYLSLGFFTQYSVVTSQRTHFVFCNLKVKIIQGRSTYNNHDCQINHIHIKSVENIIVRTQWEKGGMITIIVIWRPPSEVLFLSPAFLYYGFSEASGRAGFQQHQCVGHPRWAILNY